MSTLPDRLTELAPGPVLAGLLESLDPAGVDVAELTDLIEARARQIAHLRALMLPEILRAARQVIADQPSDVWASLKRRYAADLIAITLHCSLRWAQLQINLAEGLEELSMVYEALLAGRIDEARAAAFVDGLAHVQDRALAAQIASRLLARASRWSLAELRERLRYHVDRKDPEAARRRNTRRVANRNVLLLDGLEGTAQVSGCDLPADKASAPRMTGWTGWPGPPAAPATRARWVSCGPTRFWTCWPGSRSSSLRARIRSALRLMPTTGRPVARSGRPARARSGGRAGRRVRLRERQHPRHRPGLARGRQRPGAAGAGIPV